jgi:lipopolysaccharide heptosyltransferase II
MKLMKNIKKILIIMMGGIGDMVHFTPTIANVHKHFPEAIMSFLVYKSKAEELVKNAPFVDKVYRVEIDVNTYNIIPRLRKENYEMAIISSGTNPFKSGMLCYLSGIPCRVAEKNFWCTICIEKQENKHFLDHNLKLAEAIGCTVRDKSMKIWFDDDALKYKKDLIKRYDLKNKQLIIGVHPGSEKRLAFKRWPIEKYGALLNYMHKKYQASFIIFGGPDEAALAKELEGLVNFRPINLVGTTTVLQAAASISLCHMFLSNDSGLMHLATAFAIPVVAIYGPSQYIKSAPYGQKQKHIIVRHELPCSPCYDNNTIKCKHLKCINDITVEEVLSALESQIKKLPKKTTRN